MNALTAIPALRSSQRADRKRKDAVRPASFEEARANAVKRMRKRGRTTGHEAAAQSLPTIRSRATRNFG